MRLELKSHSVRVGWQRIHIIDNLDLSFADDRCHCLVGINGVGKTSLLLSLTKKNALRRADGAWQPATYLTPRELIAAEAMTVHRFAGLFPRRLALDRWALSGAVGRSVQSLSHGEKTRLTLSIADALDPQVLLLDEPSLGLDFDSQELLRGLIDDRVNRRRTTLISTHDLTAFDTETCRIIYLYRENGLTRVAEDRGSILSGSADVRFQGERPRRIEGSAAGIARTLLRLQAEKLR